MSNFWTSDFVMKRLYRVLFVISFLVMIVFFIESCEEKKHTQMLQNNISQLNLENQKFKTEITKTNQTITSQSQIILTQKEAIVNGLIEIERLKNIKSKVRVVTSTQIDTLFVPYDKVVSDTIYDGKIDYRRYFSHEEANGWYLLNGFASDDGINIEKLSVKNDFSIYIADKKIGLFKKPQPEVLLLSKNPYTETIQMSNVVITMYQPFYKKNIFWFGVGALGGVLLAK